MAGACGGAETRPDPQRLALERERASLERYLAEAEHGQLVPFDGLLVVVRDDLIRQVVQAGLPHRAPVGDRYLLDLERADVRFRSGLALVELDGRAALADRPDVFADLVVIGTFQVTGLDRHRSTLRARVEILGFETRHVGVGGLSAPLERLVDGLAAERATELNEVLGQLEIPIQLGQEIRLPAVEERDLTISARTLPIRLEVTDVKVLEDRLWISLSADMGEPPTGADE